MYLFSDYPLLSHLPYVVAERAEEDSYNMICGIEAAAGSSNLYRATWHFAGGDEYVDEAPALGPFVLSTMSESALEEFDVSEVSVEMWLYDSNSLVHMAIQLHGTDNHVYIYM